MQTALSISSRDELARLDQAQNEIRRAIAELEKVAKCIGLAIKQAYIIDDRRSRTTTARISQPCEKPKQAVRKGHLVIMRLLLGSREKSMSAERLAARSGYAPGTLRTYLPALKEEGWIEESSNPIVLTPEGIAKGSRFF